MNTEYFSSERVNRLRLFLDSANIECIRQAARLGIVTGVTTKPTLLAKVGRADSGEVIEEICSLVPGPVWAGVLSLEAAGMIEKVRQISTWVANMAAKVPITMAGD